MKSPFGARPSARKVGRSVLRGSVGIARGAISGARARPSAERGSRESRARQPARGRRPLSRPRRAHARPSAARRSPRRRARAGGLSAFAFVTSRAAGAVAHLSFDERYLATRDKSRGRAQQPKSVADGLARGARSLGAGVVQGVTGLLVQPVRGFREEGALGLCKGVGKGIVGVAVKPTAGAARRAAPATSRSACAGCCPHAQRPAQLRPCASSHGIARARPRATLPRPPPPQPSAGVLDLLSRTAQGAANQARGSSTLVALHRVRPPRILYGEKKVVREYVHAEAAAHEVLAEFRAGKHRREPLIHCVDLIPQRRAGGLAADVGILTDKRLLLAVWTTKRVVRHIGLDEIDRTVALPQQPSELLLTARQEPWQVSVSETQQQMRACMRSRRSRAQEGDSQARSAQRTQVVRLECGSEAKCNAFIQQLMHAKEQRAPKGSRASVSSQGESASLRAGSRGAPSAHPARGGAVPS